MNWKNLFTRPKVVTDPGAPFTHRKGYLFDPGAEIFAYVPEQADPTFLVGVFSGPRFHYNSLDVVNDAPQVWKDLSLAPSPLQGYIYGGFQFDGLIDPADYPDIPTDIG